MTKIEFKPGCWEESFVYAYNSRFSQMPKFKQAEDCILNCVNPQREDGFDYTTIMSKQMFEEGSKIAFSCSFEDYGAPLFIIADNLEKDNDGNLWYGVGYEVVLWEKGINVWEFFLDNGELKYHKSFFAEFEVKSKTIHRLQIELLNKYIGISVNDKNFVLRAENLPSKAYVGVTGCENINRIYSFEYELK